MGEQDTVTRILAVDDEEQVLSALRRVFRGPGFKVEVATSGKAALDLMSGQAFDIIISDMRMPEMDGASFLARSIELAPSARRILLTGYSDQESTIRAINEGQVHQYITKPWDNQAIRDLIASESIIKQELSETAPEYITQLKSQVAEVGAELKQATTYADLARDELLKQVNTSIKVISGLVNHLVPTPHGFTQNVISHSVAMAKLLKMDKGFMRELRTAALLFQLGKLTLGDELRGAKIFQLTEEQSRDYQSYALMGANILTPISGLDFASKIIADHMENFDGSGPQHLKGKSISLGARILRLCVDFQQLISGLMVKDPLSTSDACEYLDKYSGKKYDPALTKLYIALVNKLADIHPESQDKLILPNELEEGMVISRDVTSNEGLFLLAKSTELNAALISKLRAYIVSHPQELNIFIQPQNEKEA